MWIGLLFVLICIRLPNTSPFRSAQAFPRRSPTKHHFSEAPLSQLDANKHQALQRGKWVKFICGASNQDLPLVRNLCFLYTLVGVDCIDVSSDLAVVLAANEGIQAACRYRTNIVNIPLLMVSINDGVDAHFRKAYFDPAQCPADCPRPCERVCPAAAIPPLSSPFASLEHGVISDRCYGCGRCLSVCPLGLIGAISYSSDPQHIRNLFQDNLVNAVEIHTSSGHETQFERLWEEVHDFVLPYAKVISVSLPNMAANTLPFIRNLQLAITASPHWQEFRGVQIWQSDGRAMSGDIGNGTTHATVQHAQNILANQHDHALSSLVDFTAGRHFVQLAGGTNIHSRSLVDRERLSCRPGFGGFGFGSYARKAISNKLHRLSEADPSFRIEEHRELFEDCIKFASKLITSVKDDI